MAEAATTTAHVTIHGRVQGVGFRAWLWRRAADRRLGGWVRNRKDGSVEAMFVGPAPVVAEMVELCADGPRYAAVSGVEVLDGAVVTAVGEFEIRPTA